jgi:hypothetical protein
MNAPAGIGTNVFDKGQQHGPEPGVGMANATSHYDAPRIAGE